MGQRRYRSLVLHTTEQNIFKIIICHKFLEAVLKSQYFPFLCVSQELGIFANVFMCVFTGVLPLILFFWQLCEDHEVLSFIKYKVFDPKRK